VRWGMKEMHYVFLAHLTKVTFWLGVNQTSNKKEQTKKGPSKYHVLINLTHWFDIN
jgi:hypothetical protein